MKNQLIKFIAAGALVCGLSVNANAQSVPSMPSTPAVPAAVSAPSSGVMSKVNAAKGVEARLSKMKTDLNLSDDQTTKMKTVLQDEMTARASKDPATIKANHAKMKADMAQILTPEQMTKYKQMAMQKAHMK